MRIKELQQMEPGTKQREPEKVQHAKHGYERDNVTA